MKLIMKEQWKSIPGYSNYQASSFGRIKNRRTGYIFFRRTKTNRYWHCELNGKDFLIHRLILLAFVGPAPKGKEGNHINGNRYDNHLWNLEYISPYKNIYHAGKRGLRRMVLTKRKVRRMRRLYRKGWKVSALARCFKISYGHCYEVVVYKHWWKHV